MKIEKVIKQLESILDHTRSMAASPDADEIWKEDSDALEFALTALRSMPEAGEYHLRDGTKMVPLSLEQLKQMNGKPVWGKSLINEKPGEWFILRVVNMSKTWFIACAGAEQGFGDKDTYGKTWLAYPYPPAHIDRSKWEKCELCSLTDGKPASRLILAETCNGEAKYCPRCGRPLTEEAWAELERRLRG